jgi:hypothetical protein
MQISCWLGSCACSAASIIIIIGLPRSEERNHHRGGQNGKNQASCLILLLLLQQHYCRTLRAWKHKESPTPLLRLPLGDARFVLRSHVQGALYTPRPYLYTGVEVENLDATFYFIITSVNPVPNAQVCVSFCHRYTIGKGKFKDDKKNA